MTEFEIALARAYLTASGQDPVAALIRSVKDLARIRRRLSGASRSLDEKAMPAPASVTLSLAAAT